MAKLTRVTQLIYGLNGDPAHFGQFGSKAAGAPVLTLDPASIQSLSAFQTNGWLDAVVNANKQPFLEDMNGLFRVAFYQLGSIFQDGIPSWDGGTIYYTGSIVRKDGTFELYGSTTDNNSGNPLPSKTNNGNWQYLNPPTTAPGIMCDFGGSVAPFGYLLCDGTAYPQTLYPDLYGAIGSGWNVYRGAADPGAGFFRVPDTRGQTKIGAGQAPGLSNRTFATFVGEETHVLTVTEMPAHVHTMYARTLGAAPSTPNYLMADLQQLGSSHTPSTDSAGGGAAHNIMQPSAVVTSIIKY